MNVNLYEMIQVLKMITEVTTNVLIPLSAVVMAGFVAAVVREFFKMRKKEETAVVEMFEYEEELQVA